MKIVVASDSMKGSLTGGEVGEAVKAGVTKVCGEVEIDVVAIADGGEGTVGAILKGEGWKKVWKSVEGPMGDTVRAYYGIKGDKAVIEMAQASGLTLVREERLNPIESSSFGTGELIRDALERGCKDIIVGLGGSATNDGGVGMLQALGYRFLDYRGRNVGRGGGVLGKIVGIDESNRDFRLRDARFVGACDVTNPLTGVNGASCVFGPQKGASAVMVSELEAGMNNFSSVARQFLGRDVSNFPGSGAAGGMGFSIIGFLQGKLERGIELVLDAIEFDKIISAAALVITGEGRLDSQTCMGKGPYGVLLRATERGIPTVGIGGSIESASIAVLKAAGFAALYSISDESLPLPIAMRRDVAMENVARTAERIIKDFKAGRMRVDE